MDDSASSLYTGSGHYEVKIAHFTVVHTVLIALNLTLQYPPYTTVLNGTEFLHMPFHLSSYARTLRFFLSSKCKL